VETLRANSDRPVESLLKEIIAAPQQFSWGEQQDDITLVVARHTLPRAA
jgi:serine phosphatase RsbU (regulator of sigma subunit)